MNVLEERATLWRCCIPVHLNDRIMCPLTLTFAVTPLQALHSGSVVCFLPTFKVMLHLGRVKKIPGSEFRG
ncbi:hypothetical protein XELAEV_18008027mg [Xenopus laevis]|uniref:Uncharacterized protein n=1 Tax=Xenopus laevis TaxID=8355 RepID=A0A974E305_XENLA|nr:hypothetical protein XELAEV_18008027mg [Xenopus laevis]